MLEPHFFFLHIYILNNMVNITGRTTRSLFVNIVDKIKQNEIANMQQFTQIQSKRVKQNIAKLAYDVLCCISGNEPIQLIDQMLNNVQKVQSTPINQVPCVLHLFNDK